MKNSSLAKCTLGCVLLWTAGSAFAQVADSPVVVGDQNHSVHIYPTPSLAPTLPPAGVLLYNGGPIMPTLTTYAIFWLPSRLQNGASTSMSTKYQPVIKNFLGDYPAHGIANNSTQYFSSISGTTTYVKSTGGFGGFVVDTNPYPASGCNDGVTGTNCITDAQLQAEISRVMGVKGWTSGLNKMFLVFTSSGEGSCFNGSSTSCAYTDYCAYHGYFGSTASPVIYGNMPYADPTYCSVASQKFPSGDHFADAAVNVTSHEMTEADTDPELNAWQASNGEEIGDLCAWTFGTLSWDTSLANQMWNGRFYDLQLEYDNHTSACVQLGP